MVLSALHFIIIFPLLAALAVPFFYKFFNRKIHIGWIVLFVPAFIFIYLFRQLPLISSGGTVYASIPWISSLDISFSVYLDGLGFLFSLLISGIGILVNFYSIFYMGKNREELHRFYIYLLLFMGAMLGVVLSDNVLVLYVFWEMTSVSSFLLIAYWYERKASRAGALKAFLITIFGGLALLAGLIMLVMISDTQSIREMIANRNMIQESDLFLPAMISVLLGAFTKSAQFPFSIWLPDAMEAPTPVSAYLHSATMVKAGIYLVARFTFIFGGNGYWFWIVTMTGLITLLYGSLRAVRQTDLKALLAFSTISQLGLIMSLFGIGSAALSTGTDVEKAVALTAVFAGIFHLFNHSTFKGSLFMAVGIIDHETGTRDIRRLGGLLKIMPATFAVSLGGALSMAGLPPFNGYLSKEMFFKTVYDAANQLKLFGVETFGILLPVIAWAASVFTFIYCMIFVFKTFFGELHVERLPKKDAREASAGMLLPPVVLAFLVLAGFFIPNKIADLILKPAMAGVFPGTAIGHFEIEIASWHGLSPEFLMTIGVVAAGSILFLLIKNWNRVLKIYPEKWSLNYLYQSGLEGLETFSSRLTDRYMTGSLRHYLLYIVAFFILVNGLFLFTSNLLSVDMAADSAIAFYEFGIVAGMAVAAITVLLTNNRITAIAALGAVGYLMVILFVMLRAPDLALTQMVVETVTTVLFLLCFYHLPKMEKRMKPVKIKRVNLVISFAVGLVVTLFTLSAKNHRMFESIAKFYEDAYNLAGAKNIVNAILVDFRGFDTMLEITVLTIAGLGVYTLAILMEKGDADETE